MTPLMGQPPAVPDPAAEPAWVAQLVRPYVLPGAPRKPSKSSTPGGRPNRQPPAAAAEEGR
jgi:hypothetical protein